MSRKNCAYDTRRFKILAKIESFSQLEAYCNGADGRWRLLCIGAVQNLGVEHLNRGDTTWIGAHTALRAYVFSLVAEYGIPEDEAFRDVVAEINHIRSLY